MEQQEINIDDAASEIGKDLFGEAPQTEVAPPPAEAAPPVEVPPPADAGAPDPVVAFPSSWKKDYQPDWEKVDPRVRGYINEREQQMLDGLKQYKDFHGVGKTVADIVKPYEPMLKQLGIDAPKAISYLLAAHSRLTHGDEAARRAAYEELGRSLGFAQQVAQAQVDPALQQIMERQTQLERVLTQEHQRRYEETLQQTTRDVASFAEAKDEAGNLKHPYIDELADDIAQLLNAGVAKDLDDAYAKAMWANPVTREKETARLKEQTERELREKGARKVVQARKAASPNVRSQDTKRVPTAPLGTMDDTLRETLEEIRGRA